MGKIVLEGMEFFSHHGYYEEEQKLGNRYTVDVTMYTDFSLAASQDQLEGTVDYEGVYKIVESEMSTNAQLLEHLCHKINQSILAKFGAVEKVETTVSKHNPPLKGICAKASVMLESSR